MRLSDQEIDTLCKAVETTQRGDVALVFARRVEAEVAKRCELLCRDRVGRERSLGRSYAVIDCADAIEAAYKEPTNG